MINKFFLLAIVFCLSACGSWGRIYYGNYTYPPRNFQQDQTICSHYADTVAPLKSMPYMQGNTNVNTHGNIIFTDPYGQTYTGNYNQQSVYTNSANNYNNIIGAINNFGSTMNHSNAYSACMAKLGWVQISKEEYDRITGKTLHPSKNH